MFRQAVEVIKLKTETRQAIADYFMDIALKGYDVQEFDLKSKYGGTKKSLSQQEGYYTNYDILAIKKLSYAIMEILQVHEEYEALRFFKAYRNLFTSCDTESNTQNSIPYVQKIDFLPRDSFVNIDPADLISPNGYRIPEYLQSWEEIREYSARLLMPKLVLAAIAGILNQLPWMDVDMDLNSTMHTMRPDKDKNHVNSGYGGGSLHQHTDGYWNPKGRVPLTIVFLGISNPNNEPTGFIPIESIFRIPHKTSPIYSSWLQVFEDLIPENQSVEDFVKGVVKEALKPQFSFVMGVVGGDAQRGVYQTPLLEEDGFGGYLLRAKSTFKSSNPETAYVVEFVNRMINFLSSQSTNDAYIEVSLSPGELYLALNGSGLRLNDDVKYESTGFMYPVIGAATVHGRGKLTAIDGKINRTLARGNCLKIDEKIFYAPHEDSEALLAELTASGHASASLDIHTFFPEKGAVHNHLQCNFRGNALLR